MSTSVAIQIDSLSKQFGGRFRKPVRAVNNLNLQVETTQLYSIDCVRVATHELTLIHET